MTTIFVLIEQGKADIQLFDPDHSLYTEYLIRGVGHTLDEVIGIAAIFRLATDEENWVEQCWQIEEVSIGVPLVARVKEEAEFVISCAVAMYSLAGVRER